LPLKTQPGNPHKLKINQHFHTAHCIGRFSDKTGLVQIKLNSSDKIIKRGRRSREFCVSWVWDQKAENGYMKRIEDAFHHEIDCISLGSIKNNMAISEYHLLWNLRHKYQHFRSDIFLNGIDGSNLTKDNEEIIERKHGMFVRDDGAVPARFLVSFLIQRDLDKHIHSYAKIKWALLQAEEGEFLVADCYHEGAIMPISPKLCFVTMTDDRMITREEVAAINRKSLSLASKFCFAQDFEKCPL